MAATAGPVPLVSEGSPHAVATADSTATQAKPTANLLELMTEGSLIRALDVNQSAPSTPSGPRTGA